MNFSAVFSNYLAEFITLHLILAIGIPVVALASVFLQWSFASHFSPSKLHREIRGRHCLVTGGSKGLGEAIAIELAQAGAHVTIVARGKDALEAAVKRIHKNTLHSDQKIHSFSVDLSDPSQVNQFVRDLKSTVGLPDWVISNAGTAEFGFLADQLHTSHPSSHNPVAEKMMNVNFFGTVNVIRALFLAAKEETDPQYISNGNGKSTKSLIAGLHEEQMGHLPERIILVGSVLSLLSYTGASAYTASKYALRGLADSLRSEFLPFGTHVHVYFPANMDTPGFEEENKTKPQITAEIEGTASTMTSREAAQRLLANVLHERFYITNDFLGEMIRVAVSGSAPRPSPVSDILAIPLVSFIFFVWSLFADYSVKSHFKKTLSSL